MNSKVSKHKSIVIALLSLLSMSYAHCAVTLTPGKSGLQISGVSDKLTFTLAYPILVSLDKKKSYKSTGSEVTDTNTVVVKYEGGEELTIDIEPTGAITLKGVNVPPEIGFVEMRMNISQSFNTDGTWQFDSGDSKPFPLAKPEKPHLYQGNAITFTIRTSDGKGIMLAIPEHSYQELADLRAWGSQSFGWMSMVTYTPDTELTYQIEEAPSAPGAPVSPASP